MKKTKFTEQQIVFALRQAKSGTRMDEVCRKMGISEDTFTIGRKSMVVWALANFVNCDN